MKDKILKSILAGIAIALSGWIYLSTQNQIIGAFLFSCGLLCVRIYPLNLFTGKIQFIGTHTYKWYDYFIFFFGNMLGVLLISLISFSLVGTLPALETIMANKMSQTFLVGMLKGIGCGALMSLATYKEAPFWMCILCVMGFILAGFNHCIADAYYFLVSKNLSISFIGTILGNIIGGVMLSNSRHN